MKTSAKISVPPLDLGPYAGRWVAVLRGRVVGVGLTAAQARAAAQHARPKETPQVNYVPEQISNTQYPILDWPLVQAAADVLAKRKVEGLIVGGAVRDVLLGRPVHDWDFAVERDAIPLARETANRLGAAYYTLDAERETGRVVVRSGDGSRTFLDFALRRGESWVADLVSRDFALNAIGVSLNPPGQLYDPTGGRADLEARQVRAATESSFRDDPVRVLRCVRVAAMLGFGIEPQTAAWARLAAPQLERISAERVRDELARLLTMTGTVASLRQLDDLSALELVLPEAILEKTTEQSRPHHWNVFEHTLMLIEMLEHILDVLQVGPPPQSPPQAEGRERGPVPQHVWGDLVHTLGPYSGELTEHLAAMLSDERTALCSLKLAALLHDCGKPATLAIEQDGRTRFFNHDHVGAEMAAARARALRFANVEVERVRTIVANHMRPQQLADAGLSARGVYRYFRDTGDAGIDIVLLALADHLATHGPDLQPERWEKRLNVAAELIGGYLERVRASMSAPPLVTGGELMKALGLHPGPRIGELLEAIREAQVAGEIHSKQEAIELARKHKSLLDSGK